MALSESSKRALLKGLADGERENRLAKRFGLSRERVRQYKVQHLQQLQPKWGKRRQANLKLLEPFLELVGVNRRCRMCGCDLRGEASPSAYCSGCKERRQAIRYVISRLRTYLNSPEGTTSRAALNISAYLVRKYSLTPEEVELYLRGRV